MEAHPPAPSHLLVPSEMLIWFHRMFRNLVLEKNFHLTFQVSSVLRKRSESWDLDNPAIALALVDPLLISSLTGAVCCVPPHGFRQASCTDWSMCPFLPLFLQVTTCSFFCHLLRALPGSLVIEMSFVNLPCPTIDTQAYMTLLMVTFLYHKSHLQVVDFLRVYAFLKGVKLFEMGNFWTLSKTYNYHRSCLTFKFLRLFAQLKKS